MNDSNDGKPPVPLEPEVLMLWRKVFPRLAHYFAYPEPQFVRDFDEYGQKRSGGRPQRATGKPDGKLDGKSNGK